MAVTAGRRIGKLTARFVETTKTAGLHGDGGGLYLKVGDSGAKSWIVRWSSAGNVHKLGLGATHTVSLVRARERAADVRRLILDGIDPREARRAAAIAEAKSISFDDACERYIASHRAGWKTAKHVRQWQTTLATYASPVLGKLPVSAIDTGMVMRVLAPLWTVQNATAFRLRGRLEAVLAWSKVHGYRSGENPAVWRNNLDHLLPTPTKVRRTVHHAAMPYSALPAFLRELRRRPEISARALELAILDCDPNRRGAERDAVRVRSRQQALDHPGRAHEGWARAPRSTMRARRGNRDAGGVATTSLPSAVTQRCWPCCAGWDTHASRCTVFVRASATGAPSRRISRAKSPKWRWRTRSATGSKRHTGAATCWKSGVS